MAGQYTTVRLNDNVPLIGTPRWAKVVASKIDGAPQLKLTGNWDGVQGLGNVYLHASCNQQMATLGLIRSEPDGSYAINGSPRITLLKSNGQTHVTLATGAAPPRTVQQPQHPANGYTPPPATNGHAAPTPAHSQNNVAEFPGETFKRLKITMAACIKASREAWIASLPAGEIPPAEQVAATAHSLFIAADRRNCLSPLPPKPVGPITDAQKAEIDSVSECLATRHVWTRERLQTEILGVTQAAELAKLTEPQAKIAIDHLQRKLRELDEAAAVAAQAQQQRAAATASPDEEIPW